MALVRISFGEALAEIKMEDWAGALRRFCAAPVRRPRGVLLRPGLVERFERWYAAILAEVLALRAAKGPPRARQDAKPKRRKEAAARRKTGHNLLLDYVLFLRRATGMDTLRFLRDAAVPGGFRLLEDAASFAAVRA